MAVTINIPTALRQFTGGSSRLEVEATTAGEALDRLTSVHTELRRHLYDNKNVLRSFVNVYLNDDDIRHQSGADTPIKDGDTLMIVPSIAGGITTESQVAPALPLLSNDEVARYSRHLSLPEVGLQGQRRLKAASVLMIGTGGLGAPTGMYLAAAGVGRLGIVDFDVVEASNLQRQIIHGTADVGRPKVESARDRLRDINPHVEIETHETQLNSGNALRLFANYDIIVDGTDNFPTRYLVNDACV
ncbi:MAG: ThiF family adenylyltransferase, partial [Acidobacteriota bacterium]|nr:ThiF family adenylyltransferase [Acidobacteriota bacterium]